MHIDSAPAVTIGFEQTIYSVEEDGGSIEVCAAIRNGTLRTSVEAVMMATVDGTAIGTYVRMYVYVCLLYLHIFAIN